MLTWAMGTRGYGDTEMGTRGHRDSFSSDYIYVFLKRRHFLLSDYGMRRPRRRNLRIGRWPSSYGSCQYANRCYFNCIHIGRLHSHCCIRISCHRIILRMLRRHQGK